MKKISLVFIVLSLNTCSLVAQSMEQIVADKVIPLANNEDFEFLLPLLQGKRIVLIGEAIHLDGSTIETRANMIRYLTKHLGFNTVGLEPLTFVNGMILKDSIEYGKQPDIRKYLNAPNLFFHQQSEPLWKMIMNREIDFMGIDDYAQQSYMGSLKNTTVGKTMDIDWERFSKTIHSLFRNFLSQDDIDFVIRTISTIENSLKKAVLTVKNEKIDILLQGLENVKTTFLAHMDFSPEDDNDKNIINGVSLRDRQMARNIIWYTNQFPEAKLIVWCANSHALAKY
jgi:hypothetical protein